MNVDGFGIGWYADGDPIPARYRQAGPIWADDSLVDLARVTRTRAMLGAVRSASVGTDTGASSTAPYADGSWLFSLNGALVGWSAAAGGPVTPRRKRTAVTGAGLASGPPAQTVLAAVAARAEAAGDPISEPSPVPPPMSLEDAAAAVLRLCDRLPSAELLRLAARCDTALIWAIVQIRLRADEPPARALAGTIADFRAAGVTGRFNLLLTDGQTIAATAAGDTLYYWHRPDGVIVASEPSDDAPGWQEVPDESVVEATPAGVTVRPLTAVSVSPQWPAGTVGNERAASA
jgi:gamma-glutamyl hercynylcysteine S-oxide hydrolase